MARQQETGTPAGADNSEPALEDRLDGLEAEQASQRGMLEKILERLPGSPPGGSHSGQGGRGDDPPGKSVAELVRDGIEQLEAEKARKSAAETEAAERADHAARLAALEERTPAELIDTGPGRFRAAVQRVGFGIERPGR